MQMTPHSPSRSRASHAVALTALLLIFLWVYGRFAFGLYFVMDDFIHSASEMTGPFWPTLRDTFAGVISWSGYRPLSTALRVVLTHAFGLERMGGYYVIYLSLHFINTLLTYRLVRRVGHSVLWAFFAAAVVLLLPSHNEAVFWFAATSNVLALLFALLALDFALTATDKPGSLRSLAMALAYLCAVLAYEVALPLPLLIFAADWIRNGRPGRSRLRFYGLLALVGFLLLALRLMAQDGALVPARSDYAASLDLGHFVRNYLLLFSQMLLLYTSPYPGAPLYGWSRNWLEPTGSLAITTIALTAALTIAVFGIALRARRTHAGGDMPPTRRQIWLWFAWGLLWMLAMGLAFASLIGRNPENRYTYLLSFGFAISLTALLAALYRLLQRVRALQYAQLGLMAGLIAFYAYVSVGDAVDWTAAGALVRASQETIHAAIPTLEADQAIGQIGIPAHVGSAYTYAIEPAFQDAMRLLYGTGQPAFAGNASVRAWFTDNPEIGKRTYAFTWDDTAQRVVPLVAVILCKTYDDCQYYDLRRPDGSSKNRGMRYVQIFDPDNPQMGGAGLFATLQPYAVHGCYGYLDETVDADPDAFADYPLGQRCEDAITAFWDYSE